MSLAAHYLFVTLTIRLPWQFGRRPSAEPLQLAWERFRSQTPYGHALGLNAEPSIDSLPVVDLLDFMCHMDRFSARHASGSRPETLFLPTVSSARTAVVGRPVRWSPGVKQFPALAVEELWKWKPDTLAARLDDLRSFAHPDRPRPLRNGLVVFTDVLQGPLTAAQCDRLWATFQVPVFEQFLGFEGELLAWECEAHHGLHVKESAARFEAMDGAHLVVSLLASRRFPVMRLATGLRGRLSTAPCPCGNRAPRLLDVQRAPVHTRSTGTRAAAVG